MIDVFSLGITHALMLIALWRIARRPDLDRAEGGADARAWGQRTDA